MAGLNVMRRLARGPWTRNPVLRRGVKVGLDLLAAVLAMAAACAALGLGAPPLASLAGFAALALACNLAFGFHAQHYRAMGLGDAWRLMLGSLALAAVVTAVGLAYPRAWPGGLGPGPLLAACLLLGPLWLGLRLGCLPRRGAGTAPPGARILIVGAGGAGILACRELRGHPGRGGQVLGFVEDDPALRGLRIQGIPVLGPTALLPRLIRRHRVNQVVLAMDGGSEARVMELRAMARAEGVEVRCGAHGLAAGQPSKSGVRDVSLEHLLRRAPVALDGAAMRAEVTGSVVLITGGGGSIGRELARALAGFGPERVVLLGHGEHSLWEARRALASQVPGLPVELALCDIRNPAGLRQALRQWRPGVVLHAAAHKHAPFLEDHPEEAVENNILGTRRVLEAALEHGVHTFVNLSTDRAAKPVSVLGVSKRIAEQVVARAAAPGARLVTVRLGNVLGSRGSVVQVFMDQIRRGGPVTVTHPDMVRYFLTLREAAQLALLAGLRGCSGKVYVLDMGEPVRIADLAREMIWQAGFRPGADMDLRFTGLRPGEQLFEDLFTAGEARPSQLHTKVFEVLPDPTDARLLACGLTTLEGLAAHPGPGRERGFLDCFLALVPTYRPSPAGLGRLLAADGESGRRGLGAIA